MVGSLVVAALVLAAGQNAPARTDDAEAAKIAAAHARFIGAINAGDIDGAFEYLTDDFIGMIERQPNVTKERYRASLKSFVLANRPDYQFTVDERVVSGSVAYELVRYFGSYTSKAGGTATPVSWRAVAIWRRQPDGRWLVARYIRTPDPPS
jgi:ketosteroid isomerase-like protein